MKVKMILATGLNYELGKDDKLLWHLPDDMKYFKEQTEGYYVVMGNNTFKSLNMPKGLKNRNNIVLTKEDLPVNKRIRNQYNPRYCVWFTDLETFRENVEYEVDRDIWVIGGASVYEQLIEFVDEVHWTEIMQEFPEADTYLPAKVVNEIGNKFRAESVDYFTDEKTGIQFKITVMTRK